jgi:hypothetical protein
MRTEPADVINERQLSGIYVSAGIAVSTFDEKDA